MDDKKESWFQGNSGMGNIFLILFDNGRMKKYHEKVIEIWNAGKLSLYNQGSGIKERGCWKKKKVFRFHRVRSRSNHYKLE